MLILNWTYQLSGVSLKNGKKCSFFIWSNDLNLKNKRQNSSYGLLYVLRGHYKWSLNYCRRDIIKLVYGKISKKANFFLFESPAKFITIFFSKCYGYNKFWYKEFAYIANWFFYPVLVNNDENYYFYNDVFSPFKTFALPINIIIFFTQIRQFTIRFLKVSKECIFILSLN